MWQGKNGAFKPLKDSDDDIEFKGRSVSDNTLKTEVEAGAKSVPDKPWIKGEKDVSK